MVNPQVLLSGLVSIGAHEKPVLGFESVYAQKVFARYFEFLRSVNLERPGCGDQSTWIAEFVGSNRPAKDIESLATFCESRLKSNVKQFNKFRRKSVRELRISDLLRVRQLDSRDLGLDHFRADEVYFSR